MEVQALPSYVIYGFGIPGYATGDHVIMHALHVCYSHWHQQLHTACDEAFKLPMCHAAIMNVKQL